MPKVIGVDIGGTTIKVGLVSKGKVLSKAVIKTDAKKGKKEVINNIVRAINSVKVRGVKMVGVGCPGPLDFQNGIILSPPNLPLKNTKLKNILEKKTGMNVKIDNDVNCFVLAESIYGAGKGKAVVIGLALGTGVGGGIVIDQKLFHGRSNAGEFGHMTINCDGYKSRCGNDGCLEEHAGARAVLRGAGLKGIRVKTPLELFELAKGGNKKAKLVFEDVGRSIGIGVANLIWAFDPDCVVIGGQISWAWKFFNKSLKLSVKKRYPANVKILRARLKDAGVIGAACLVDL